MIYEKWLFDFCFSERMAFSLEETVWHLQLLQWFFEFSWFFALACLMMHNVEALDFKSYLIVVFMSNLKFCSVFLVIGYAQLHKAELFFCVPKFNHTNFVLSLFYSYKNPIKFYWIPISLFTAGVNYKDCNIRPYPTIQLYPGNHGNHCCFTYWVEGTIVQYFPLQNKQEQWCIPSW